MSKHKGRGEFRRFAMTAFSVRHPTSVMVMMTVIIIAGIVSYIKVPKESNPEITIPNIIVTTLYPGVAPDDIETLITQKLEDELNNITDVKTISSVSLEGYSNINVEFEAGIDMNEALQQVREKVDIAKPEIPDAAEEPQIQEVNLDEFPILQVNIAGDYDLVRLRDVAEDLQDKLEQLPSVLEVQLAGGLEREVFVDVDLAKLKFYDLAFEDVIDAIRNENVTIPGGSIDVGEMKYLVRVPGEFADPAPIADIVVVTRDGRPIYVRDIARVDFGFKERDSYARLDGKPVVTLSVSKRSGENIIATAQAVRRVIDETSSSFPPGTVVKVTDDQSGNIFDMLNNLQNNIISGLILVVGVLLFFLGVQTAALVGAAIPLSMLLSFSIIQLAGMSMNIVVLFSLILALGMLVDNGIVVVENIYRFRERGYDRKKAAVLATSEVAMPIIASTATTLAAFFPMVFWPGIVGEYMSYLPLTLIIALSSSLFVALVITPTLCSMFLDPEEQKGPPMTRAMRRLLLGAALFLVLISMLLSMLTTVLLLVTGGIVYAFHHYVAKPAGHAFMKRGLPNLIGRYERLLRWSLNHRGLVVVGAAGTLVGVFGLFLMFNAGTEYFPEDIPPETAFVQVEAPLGTRVEQTDAIVRRVEDVVSGIQGSEDFESITTTVGSQPGNKFGGGGRGTHLGSVAISFVDYQDRNHDARETLERLRARLADRIAGAEVSVELQQQGPPSGAPINIEVSGQDSRVLKELGDEIVHILEQSPVFAKLDGLESDMADSRPELVIDVDREKAALYGITTRDIGLTVRSAINGTEASKYRDGKDEYDITVRLAKEYRSDLSSISDLTIVNDKNVQIPLSSVASWYVGEGFGDVRRKDLDRVVTVSSDVRSGYKANAVKADVEQVLQDFSRSLPNGYEMTFTGQQQDQQEAEAFLMGAFFIAIALIAFILISQFDSITKPLIILSSVVMSTVGVLIGLMVFRMPFGIIMTGVGVISLAGVVVNNAIVLIDYVDVLRTRDGMNRREALVKGGMTRFRPVMLTAITTVLGLVPLAIGLNFDFFGLYRNLSPELYWGGAQAAWWGPMAIAVIAGLSFATFLTLVLVPVMYSLLDDLDDLVKQHLLPEQREAGSGEATGDTETTEEHPLPEPLPV